MLLQKSIMRREKNRSEFDYVVNIYNVGIVLGTQLAHLTLFFWIFEYLKGYEGYKDFVPKRR